MSILPSALFNPGSSEAINPFYSAMLTLENYLIAQANAGASEKKARYQRYLAIEWPKLQTSLCRRVLGLEKKGQAILGMFRRGPDENFSEEGVNFVRALSYSKYYASDLWRAFYYSISHAGNLNPRYVSAGPEEIGFLKSHLSNEDFSVLLEEADKEWPNFFEDKSAVDHLFKKLQPYIKQMCASKMRFLSAYDPAGYSMSDLTQEINCRVLSSLQACDYYNNDAKEMMAWSVRCAQNAVESLREFANAESRAAVLSTKDEDGNFEFTLRISDMAEVPEQNTLYTQKDSYANSVYSNIAYQSLLEKVDSKAMRTYLQIMWGEEQSPEFWNWLDETQPLASKRPAYQRAEPSVIGPWVQRWLGLESSDLTNFISEHMPEILEEAKRRKTRRENKRKA